MYPSAETPRIEFNTMSSPFVHVPPELIPDILSFLPVKDLLRFKSVSRSWRSLIRSSYFIKLHLSRSHKTRSNLLLLSEGHRSFKLQDFYSLEEIPDLEQPPLRDPPFLNEIVGSCNGLAILCSVLQFGRCIHFLSLWNPSTRKSRKLPFSEIRVPEEGIKLESVAYGFGYDPVNDDYKLVQSSHFKTGLRIPNFSEGMVLSFKTHIWRKVDCPFYFSSYNIQKSEALVNNALHWIIQPMFSYQIVAFNLVKEEYYIVPLPECSRSVSLSVLGGCLSMANHLYKGDCRVEVWVMNEYGVKESWSKLFSLQLTSPPNDIFDLTPTAVPIGMISIDGDKVLLNYGLLLAWYDLGRKTVEFVKRDDGAHLAIYDPRMCVGSLVWPRRKKPSSHGHGKLESN